MRRLKFLSQHGETSLDADVSGVKLVSRVCFNDTHGQTSVASPPEMVERLYFVVFPHFRFSCRDTLHGLVSFASACEKRMRAGLDHNCGDGLERVWL